SRSRTKRRAGACGRRDKTKREGGEMAKLRSTVGVALAALLCPALSLAPGSYPNRAIKIIVPFAPGGASDFVGRIMQPRLAELLGQPVVIENRGGAAGTIGMEVAARSAPDGYTLVLGNVGSTAINPGVFTNLSINNLKDFIPVTQVVDVPGVLIVHPSVAANSVKELVAYVKANPGKLNYASPGSGSQNRLEMEILRTVEGGMDMVHVPYKGGAGPAVTGLVAGETQMMFTTVSSAMGHIKSGRLKALAITSPQRIKELPEVPTMREAGYVDGSSGSWQGVLVPVGTPSAVVDRLFEVLVQTMKAPDVIERLSKGGAEAVTSPSPKAFAEFVAVETQGPRALVLRLDQGRRRARLARPGEEVHQRDQAGNEKGERRRHEARRRLYRHKHAKGICRRKDRLDRRHDADDGGARHQERGRAGSAAHGGG